MRYLKYYNNIVKNTNLEKIENLIQDEKNKENKNNHKISKLEESKLNNMVFNDMNIINGRYKLPW